MSTAQPGVLGQCWCHLADAMADLLCPEPSAVQITAAGSGEAAATKEGQRGTERCFKGVLQPFSEVGAGRPWQLPEAEVDAGRHGDGVKAELGDEHPGDGAQQEAFAIQALTPAHAVAVAVVGHDHSWSRTALAMGMLLGMAAGRSCAFAAADHSGQSKGGGRDRDPGGSNCLA